LHREDGIRRPEARRRRGGVEEIFQQKNYP